MNLIDLKERIAISDAFTAEERIFLLNAINAAPDPKPAFEESAPRSYLGRIEQIWAFLAINEGGEGIISAPIGQFQTLPLIAADRHRLELVRPYALAAVKSFNRVVRLARFRQREDEETLRP